MRSVGFDAPFNAGNSNDTEICISAGMVSYGVFFHILLHFNRYAFYNNVISDQAIIVVADTDINIFLAWYLKFLFSYFVQF